MLRDMRARELLASAVTADGATLALFRESEGFVVRLGNQVLMGSRSRGSEQAMAQVAAAALAGRRRPRVLVGGLGMGFTLRSVLDAFAADAEIAVVEMMPCVVEWNRGVLAPLSGDALADPRVRLETADVGDYLAAAAANFDAILLDVDNGPEAFSAPGNARLYAPAGLATVRAALRPGGVAVVWSAFASGAFEKALARAGFAVETLHVRARGRTRKGSHHTLFVGRTKSS
ncbi:MAG: hypothetical protein HY899_16735 [Deltaproteobacteria bacterium]|nr:hypothetical protein [Deltaproteobacteria bacterium]